LLTDVHFPLLPLELVAVHLETDTFGLNDMKGLQIVPNLEIFIIFGDEIGKEIKSPGWGWDALSIGVA